jgi:hypothetical protein
LSHFRNWDHALLFMDKHFLYLKSQPKLYYPNKERTCEQGESASFSLELYKGKENILKKWIKKNKNPLE